MNPISSQQSFAPQDDLRSHRMRRLLQSAALAALAIGFATALPVSLDSPLALSKAFADGGEGGEGGGGEGGGHDGGEHGGGEHGGGDHEGGNSGPGSDNSGPGERGGDHHEAGDDEHGDDQEAGDDDEHGERNEAGDDEGGDVGVIVPGDDDGTPDQGPGDAPAQ